MQYKVNLISIDKITSPVTVIFNEKSKDFSSGKEISEFGFDKNYLIDTVYIKDEKILIELKENDRINSVSWCGEEQIDFF